MAILNLYHITETLQRMLALNVGRLMADLGRPTAVAVTTLPPELIASATHQVNLHLFHAAEAPYHRPMAEAGGTASSVVRQPLALTLSYVLTAHHITDGLPDASEEQLLLGLAMKTMHDYRRIDGKLHVSDERGTSEQVLIPELAGSDTRLDITMRNVTAEESTMFWAAESTSTTRMSAFYEVRTVVIDSAESAGSS